MVEAPQHVQVWTRPVAHNPSPTLLPSCTYRVWPSDSSCLVIQLLSPFRVVRTFICLRTLLRSSSPAGRDFPGEGKATQLQKGRPDPGPWDSFPALPICHSLCCPGSAREPGRASMEEGSHMLSPGLTFGTASES